MREENPNWGENSFNQVGTEKPIYMQNPNPKQDSNQGSRGERQGEKKHWRQPELPEPERMNVSLPHVKFKPCQIHSKGDLFLILQNRLDSPGVMVVIFTPYLPLEKQSVWLRYIFMWWAIFWSHLPLPQILSRCVSFYGNQRRLTCFWGGGAFKLPLGLWGYE